MYVMYHFSLSRAILPPSKLASLMCSMTYYHAKDITAPTELVRIHQNLNKGVKLYKKSVILFPSVLTEYVILRMYIIIRIIVCTYNK